ncbi:MAG: hypothetical protein JKX94_07155 [Sneathiella sp.]|nr:hypothetical protein [Sneathiella sp.]
MTVERTQVGVKGYAGDLTVLQAWDMLKDSLNTALIDVRTKAEWTFVGLPDLSSIDKKIHPISWVLFPDMSPNSRFVEELKTSQPDVTAPVLFLCRSGVRSIAAAIAATNAGYANCYNVLGGFEGDLDKSSHRGTSAGWKAENLNWVQG